MSHETLPVVPRRWSLDLSTVTLIVANLVPIIGVLLFGWDAGIILLVYWSENLVVGGYNILKMVFAQGGFGTNPVSKLFAIPFFAVHFGGFCAVHGVFVYMMAQGMDQVPDIDIFPKAGQWWGPLVFLQLLLNVISGIWSQVGDDMFWPVVSLVFSHGVSFVQNYLLRGEFRKTTVAQLMIAPYGRIAVMHISIIVAAFPVMALGSPLPLLVLLILAKTLLDTYFHNRGHRSFVLLPPHHDLASYFPHGNVVDK